MDVTFKSGVLPVPHLNPDHLAMDEHCFSISSELEGFTSSTEAPMLINNFQILNSICLATQNLDLLSLVSTLYFHLLMS